MSTSIFLACCFDESGLFRANLLSIMQRAGINILDCQKSEVLENNFISEVSNAIQQANCSVHILSRDYGHTLNEDSSTSIAKYQLNEARKRLRENSDFKIFIWYPPEVVASRKDEKQEQFINEIRNSIERNMIFSNAASPIQLVDDIRNMMVKEEKTKFDIKNADVFLIFNQLDESQAAEIIDMVGDIVNVEKLNIIQDSDMDYSEYCSQQIGKSKLAVVYFKDTSEWALPFAQQIWKKVGGATSHTPILLIGDENPDTNLNKKLKAPKIISLIVAGELIPLEIKVQYDKVLEEK